MSEQAQGKALVRRVNRAQMCWHTVDVERLIADDHAARAIWEFVGRLDLSGYYECIESNEEAGGTTCPTRTCPACGTCGSRVDRLRANQSPARVSMTDPEARRMKQPDGGFAASYNVQISADAAHGAIVSLDVVQDGNDRHQLLPAVERIQQQMGRQPQQMVADGDYTIRANIEAMQERGVDFVGSLREEETPDRFPARDFLYNEQQNCYVCPQGKLLRPDGWQIRSGVRYHRYRARRRDCESCPRKPACCGDHHSRNLVRSEPSPALEAFRHKMSTEEAKAQYRKRSQVVEFCHAWIKSKLGLRQFHLRGLVKAKTEMLWAALTYNIKLSLRLLNPQPQLR